MGRRRLYRFIYSASIALVLAIGLTVGFRSLGIGAAKDSGDEQVAAPIRAKLVDGVTRLAISDRDLAASGIVVDKVASITYRDRAPAFATVLSPQPLLEQRRAHQAAVAEAERGQVAAKVARNELERLRPLHRDDRVVSDKALETAQGAVATEETNLRLATGQLHLQEAAIRQQWGQVIGGWLLAGSPQIDRILSGQDLLIQIALQTGRYVDIPAGAEVDLGASKAAIVSGAAQMDSRFQGQGFFAVAAAQPRLLPGMTIPMAIQWGAPVAGVVVADSAIVRWQGQPSVFVAVTNNEFVRRPVATEMATPDGWFVPTGLPPGASIVVRGAQLLLSEELKSRSGDQQEQKPSDDDDDDDD